MTIFNKLTCLTIFGLALLVSGCTRQEKTAGGVVIGAGSGALIGGLAGGGAGAAIGAVGGGVAGGLIGNSMGDDDDDRTK